MTHVLCSCGVNITVADEVGTAELARTIARLDAEMGRSFARIESMIANVTGDHETRLRNLEREDLGRFMVDQQKHNLDQEDRMRKLERWMYGLSGTGAGTGLVALLMQLLEKQP